MLYCAGGDIEDAFTEKGRSARQSQELRCLPHRLALHQGRGASVISKEQDREDGDEGEEGRKSAYENPPCVRSMIVGRFGVETSCPLICCQEPCTLSESSASSMFWNEKSAQRESFRAGYPADVPGQKLQAGPRNLGKQAYGCGRP